MRVAYGVPMAPSSADQVREVTVVGSERRADEYDRPEHDRPGDTAQQ
jgi:hypothetical protein